MGGLLLAGHAGGPGRRDPWTGRIRRPGVRTFSRIFGRIDAEAFSAAVCGYLAALPASLPEALPGVLRRERGQRRAARAAGRPGPAGLLPQAAGDGNEGLIAEVIAAEVLGVRPGSPGRLILGDVLTLWSGGPTGGGFTPADEDLDLGLGEEDEGGESGLGA